VTVPAFTRTVWISQCRRHFEAGRNCRALDPSFLCRLEATCPFAAHPFLKSADVQIFRVILCAATVGEQNHSGDPMTVAHAGDPSRPGSTASVRSAGRRVMLSGVEVMRDGRVEPFLHTHPILSSAGAQWSGLAVEDYSDPACVIPRHEHIENFLTVVLRGSVKYEVLTRGRTFRFTANPGTTFILPRGTVDEPYWRQCSGRPQPLAAGCHCRHESALFCRDVQAEHRARTAPICALATNRARQTKAL
jgi:hypothetical protein